MDDDITRTDDDDGDDGDDDDDDDDANDANNTNFPMMVIANNILKQSYPPSLHKHIKRKTKKTQPSYIDPTTRKLTTWFVF